MAPFHIVEDVEPDRANCNEKSVEMMLEYTAATCTSDLARHVTGNFTVSIAVVGLENYTLSEKDDRT